MSVALWQLMGGQDPQTLIRKALARMKEDGFVKVTADYSGGNDSGGVTNGRGFKADGTEIELPSAWSGDDDKYDEDSLVAICDDILGTHFGTWAGEFYAQGTLYIDPTDPKGQGVCWREGTYETPSYDDDMGGF